jgi:hypothetical protein
MLARMRTGLWAHGHKKRAAPKPDVQAHSFGDVLGGRLNEGSATPRYSKMDSRQTDFKGRISNEITAASF